mmetsp:Transcript_36787/g.113801  ORF Transcript_36787/g.113801 Transcript_36787/m.113801 type:complete len:346 (+) Transcript_36787:77-1114(+)
MPGPGVDPVVEQREQPGVFRVLLVGVVVGDLAHPGLGDGALDVGVRERRLDAQRRQRALQVLRRGEVVVPGRRALRLLGARVVARGVRVEVRRRRVVFRHEVVLGLRRAAAVVVGVVRRREARVFADLPYALGLFPPLLLLPLPVELLLVLASQPLGLRVGHAPRRARVHDGPVDGLFQLRRVHGRLGLQIRKVRDARRRLGGLLGRLGLGRRDFLLGRRGLAEASRLKRLGLRRFLRQNVVDVRARVRRVVRGRAAALVVGRHGVSVRPEEFRRRLRQDGLAEREVLWGDASERRVARRRKRRRARRRRVGRVLRVEVYQGLERRREVRVQANAAERAGVRGLV